MLNSIVKDEMLSNWILVIIYFSIVIPGLILYHNRRKYEPIKSRGYLLTILQFILWSITAIAICIPDEYGCFIRPIAQMSINPIGFAYVLRAWMIYHRHIQHKGMNLSSSFETIYNFAIKYKKFARERNLIIIWICIIIYFLILVSLDFAFNTSFVEDPSIKNDFTKYVFLRCFTNGTRYITLIHAGIISIFTFVIEFC